MVVVVVIIDTDPLLLVLLHRTFIVSTLLEFPPYFFSGRSAHPSQGSVLGVVQFDNTNGIKHPYIIGIVPVAVAVPLVPVLALIVIVRPPCSYYPHPCPFLSLVMDSMTCIHFLPEATERLVQQKQMCLENPRPSDNRRVARARIRK